MEIHIDGIQNAPTGVAVTPCDLKIIEAVRDFFNHLCIAKEFFVLRTRPKGAPVWTAVSSRASLRRIEQFARGV
jgi:hypothetical protein